MSESKRMGVWVAQWMEELGLSPNQTRLYAEIVSLNAKGGCFASNEYLGAVLRLKRDTVSRLVSQLKKKGLLKQTGFDGRKRYLLPLVLEAGSGSESRPKEVRSSRLKVETCLGFVSKSESHPDTKPSLKYEVHTNIQKSGDGKSKGEDWKEFFGLERKATLLFHKSCSI